MFFLFDNLSLHNDKNNPSLLRRLGYINIYSLLKASKICNEEKDNIVLYSR